MTDNTEQNTEQAQVQDSPPVVGRTLEIVTNGNRADIIRNEMGLFELRSILQMMLAKTEQAINAAAQPTQAAPPPEPEESDDG